MRHNHNKSNCGIYSSCNNIQVFLGLGLPREMGEGDIREWYPVSDNLLFANNTEVAN